MRILVCGGRTYTDAPAAYAALDRAHARRPIKLIIEGGAKGADRLGRQWAAIRAIPCVTFEADWDTYKKGAGFRRNVQMLVEGKPDGVIAFPGGTGTAHMVRCAQAAKVTVWQPYG